jgi:hypothetical protein
VRTGPEGVLKHDRVTLVLDGDEAGHPNLGMCTPDFGLCYSVSSYLALHGFLDADFARCLLDTKSTSGIC